MKTNPPSKVHPVKTMTAPNKLHFHAPFYNPSQQCRTRRKERELHTVLYTSGIPCAPDTTSHASLGLLALGTTLPAANMAAG